MQEAKSLSLEVSYRRFRESHHAVARMFASGMTISKVARETGYTRRRLHILLCDPSFQELIVEKAKRIEEKAIEGEDQYATMAQANMLRAEAQIQERLDEAEATGEFLPMRELLAISKDRADRFGYGPKSTKFVVTADFAVALDRAIERSAKVIEARPNPPPSSPALVESSLVGPQPVEEPALPHAQATPAQPRRGFPKAGPSIARVLRRA